MAAATAGLAGFGFDDAALGAAGQQEAGGVGLGDGVVGGVGVAAEGLRVGGVEDGVGGQEPAGGRVVLAGFDGQIAAVGVVVNQDRSNRLGRGLPSADVGREDLLARFEAGDGTATPEASRTLVAGVKLIRPQAAAASARRLSSAASLLRTS
jgi:hypothetical protein